MDVKKLVTLSFDKNVGTRDRVARLLSGAALAVGAWSVGLPWFAALPISVLGLMWLATGVLSKCSIYYMLGHSTCPLDPSARPR